MKLYREELARRICIANHQPEWRTDPWKNQVPCPTHLHQANSYFSLLEESGRKTFEAMVAYWTEGIANSEAPIGHTQTVESGSATSLG